MRETLRVLPPGATPATGMDREIVHPPWHWSQWPFPVRVCAGAGLAIGLVLLAAAVVFSNTERTVRLAASHVTVATAERGAFHDLIPLSGTVVALNTVYVDAIEGGRVQHVLAQAGDWVTAGQPLVDLSNTQLQLNVLDNEGRLIESITQLQTYQTQLEQNRVANEKTLAQIAYNIITARRALDRRKVLLAQNSVAVETVDQLQDQLNYDIKLRPMQEASNRTQEQLRMQQLPQIRRQLSTLQQDVKITHGTLDDLVVRAPVSGRLTAMDLKIGQSLGSNERVAVITPGTGYKLSAAIDEYYLGRVQKGQIAKIQFRDGATTWPLRVTRVYPQVTDGTFTVDLAFTGAEPPGLLPGQDLQGKLTLGADQKATIIPAGAFLETTAGAWIFVLTADGRSAQRHSIKIGRRNAEQVEVLGGLAPGDRVIISDYTGLDRIDRIDLR
ncbi:MAG: efflux RND transporter periplasmic adaptor subunit [Steroidobacteraceae bacterium]